MRVKNEMFGCNVYTNYEEKHGEMFLNMQKSQTIHPLFSLFSNHFHKVKSDIGFFLRKQKKQ